MEIIGSIYTGVSDGYQHGILGGGGEFPVVSKLKIMI